MAQSQPSASGMINGSAACSHQQPRLNRTTLQAIPGRVAPRFDKHVMDHILGFHSCSKYVSRQSQHWRGVAIIERTVSVSVSGRFGCHEVFVVGAGFILEPVQCLNTEARETPTGRNLILHGYTAESR